jgi:hypothetical protein
VRSRRPRSVGRSRPGGATGTLAGDAAPRTRCRARHAVDDDPEERGGSPTCSTTSARSPVEAFAPSAEGHAGSSRSAGTTSSPRARARATASGSRSTPRRRPVPRSRRRPRSIPSQQPTSSAEAPAGTHRTRCVQGIPSLRMSGSAGRAYVSTEASSRPVARVGTRGARGSTRRARRKGAREGAAGRQPAWRGTAAVRTLAGPARRRPPGGDGPRAPKGSMIEVAGFSKTYGDTAA